MKNIFRETKFIRGVTAFKSLPLDEGVEIILAGRSNAGKSSALNAICENPKLARISKTPGRTTEANFFEVCKDLKLVDLPGYGYAKSTKKRIDAWAPFLDDYFASRNSLKAAVLFMDIRHPFKESDRDFSNYCSSLAPSLELIFVLTKADKVKKNEQNKAIYFLENETGSKNIFVVSSLKSTGIDKLRGKLLSFK